MKLSAQHFVLTIFVGLLQACGNPFDIQNSCNTGFYTTNAGNRMQWQDGTDVKMQMDASVPEEMRDVVSSAGESYNSVFTKTRVEIAGPDGLGIPEFKGDVNGVSGDGVNALYWVPEEKWAWGQSDPQALAMTVVKFSHTGIEEADVFFRGKSLTRVTATAPSQISMFSGPSSAPAPLDFLLGPALGAKSSVASAAYSPLNTNPYPLEHEVFMVSVHELGHAIGRCHSNNSASIMFPTVGPGSEETRAHPLENDLSTLQQAYEL